MTEGVKYIEFSSKFSEKVRKFLIGICVEEFGFKDWKEEIETTNREKYKKDGGNFWVALDTKEDVIGTIALESIGNWLGLLKTMYVHKEFRGSIIAQNLMNILINFSVKNNYTKLQLGTYKKLKRAVNFYKKNNFYLIQEDNDVLIFEKVLHN